MLFLAAYHINIKDIKGPLAFSELHLDFQKPWLQIEVVDFLTIQLPSGKRPIDFQTSSTNGWLPTFFSVLLDPSSHQDQGRNRSNNQSGLHPVTWMGLSGSAFENGQPQNKDKNRKLISSWCLQWSQTWYGHWTSPVINDVPMKRISREVTKWVFNLLVFDYWQWWWVTYDVPMRYQ
jgi:hypothetical protein